MNGLQSHVGFESLTQAISPFARDPETLDQAFGFLLSLALANFSICNAFQSFRNPKSRESELSRFEQRIGVIVLPQAILAITKLLVHIPEKDNILPYCTFRIIERLAMFSHRNQASLNALGLGGILFERLYSLAPSHTISPQTEMIMQKLLKRMLGIGASTQDVRVMFKKVVRDGDTLESHILEILRMSMRVKWPEHFSLNGTASIELREAGGKGMFSPQGFTFMVRASLERSQNIRIDTR